MGTWKFSPSLPAGLTAVTNDNTVTVKVVSVNSNNIGTYIATYTDDDGCKKSQSFTISNCSGGGCDENITFKINSETQPSKSTTISCDEPQITLHATVPSPTPTNGYLTFTASESGTFKFSRNSINYSLDNGSTWIELASDTYSPTVQAGSKIMWKATLTPTSSGIGTFSSSGNFTVEGNPMSLLYGDDFASQTSIGGKNSAFLKLFSGCTGMTSAEKLILPATTLAANCYEYMFMDCTSLTSVPQLPATRLTSFCYKHMFKGCTSLTTAPQLLATTLANWCYQYMFSDCTSLTVAPQLPATTLGNGCYNGMFMDCTSLTTAPSLHATALTNYCYDGMFMDCKSLTVAPELLATTLAEKCYQYMFYGCTSLTTAPQLPATTLVDDCYRQMFYHCTSLNYIKAMFTTTPSLSYTSNWVNGVASSGTFVKNSAATWTSSCGLSTYPCNWTVETASS